MLMSVVTWLVIPALSALLYWSRALPGKGWKAALIKLLLVVSVADWLTFATVKNIFPTLEWMWQAVGLAPNIYQQYAAASAGYALAGVALHLLLTATGLCRVKVRDVPAPHLNEKAKTWASAAFAAALFLFNFVRIFDNNFWGDEAFSIRLAQMSVPEMLQATAEDVHPPLYYLFMILGYRCFGNAAWGYHLISVLACAALLAAAFFWVRKRFGTTAFVVFAALSTLMPTAFRNNVEVRMYSFAALFVTLAYISFYEILNSGKKSAYAAFTVFSLCAAYTHYYALISVGFLYLVLLWLAWRKRLAVRPVLIACGATVVAYLPWLFMFIQTMKRTAESFWIAYVPSFGDGLNSVFEQQSAWLNTLFQAMLIAALLWSLRGNIQAWLMKTPCSWSDLAVWSVAGMLMLAGTILTGVAVSTLVRPVFLLRYLYPVCVTSWLLFAVLLSRVPLRRAASLLVVLSLLLVQLPADLRTYRAEMEEETLCEYTLQQNQFDSDTVLLTDISHFSWTILSYYYPENENKALNMDESLEPQRQYALFLSTPLTEEQSEWLAEQGRAAAPAPFEGLLGTSTVYIYKVQ